ncbi:GPI ethanolamine phosphate transferase 2-like protein, partial [Dinothrombium tinctorium]
VDHLGHSHGRFHALMKEKLLEMDKVIEFLLKSIQNENERYLIVLTSDHGMKNNGGHGDNTPMEIETPLIFIDSKQLQSKYQKSNSERVDQLDIVNTISALLGLPFPRRSKGRIIESVLSSFGANADDHICKLYENAVHLFKLSTQIKQNDKEKKNTLKSYSKVINHLQPKLITSGLKPSLNFLYLGLSFMFFSLLFLLITFVTNSYINLLPTSQTCFITTVAYASIVFNAIAASATSFIFVESESWNFWAQTIVIVLFTNLMNSSGTKIDKNFLFHYLKRIPKL